MTKPKYTLEIGLKEKATGDVLYGITIPIEFYENGARLVRYLYSFYNILTELSPLEMTKLWLKVKTLVEKNQ
ncbi:MAG: hypothetical protein WDA42_00885 [Candidatus Bathyarchaeia archaeon]